MLPKTSHVFSGSSAFSAEGRIAATSNWSTLGLLGFRRTIFGKTLMDVEGDGFFTFFTMANHHFSPPFWIEEPQIQVKFYLSATTPGWY